MFRRLRGRIPLATSDSSSPDSCLTYIPFDPRHVVQVEPHVGARGAEDGGGGGRVVGGTGESAGRPAAPAHHHRRQVLQTQGELVLDGQHLVLPGGTAWLETRRLGSHRASIPPNKGMTGSRELAKRDSIHKAPG